MTDVNDNMPVCPDSPLFQVEEQVPIGHIIGTLEVTDRDTGENARNTFDELIGDQNNEENFLNVNETTGEIFTIK